MDQANTKRYVILQLFLLILDQIFAVITSLYIWQNAPLSTLLLFWGIQSLASIVFFFLSGWGCDHLGPLPVLRFGLAASLVQAVLLLMAPHLILLRIVPYAILTALSFALIKFPLYPINQYFAGQSEQRSFYGILSGLSQSLSVIFPIVSGLVIVVGGYSLLFITAVIASLLAGWLSIRLVIPQEENAFEPIGVLKPFTVTKKVNITVDFFWGMESGILTPFLPIATILVLGSIQYWGIFTSIAGLLSVGFSYLYAKHNSEHLSVGLVSVFALLLSALAISFSTSTSFFSFVLYIAVLKLWQTVQVTGVNYLMDSAIQKDEKRIWMRSELGLLSWIPFMAGKGILLLALLPFAELLSNKTAIGVLFTIAGFFVLQQQVTAMLSHKFTTAVVE